MKILITTGIYPPKIGGPAQYAKNLKEAFEKMGHAVSIKTYGVEGKLPTSIRHLFFFFKIIPKLLSADVVFILDTFSVGLPTILACKIFEKKGIIRTGGDFLWEQYVERTKNKILFRNFYQTEISNFSFREGMIFKLTKWTLNNASGIIFSTEWQRDIFVKAYKLFLEKTKIIENYYGPKESDNNFESRTFIASARNLVWKNSDILKSVFDRVKMVYPEAVLFTDNLPHPQFMDKMSKSYAIVLISLGDISPNIILDAIKLNRPFICTKEVGIFERIKDAGIFIDPLDKKEIEKAILNLLTEEGYREAKKKIKNFNFVHTWDKITEEFIEVYRFYNIGSIIKPEIGFKGKNFVSRIFYFLKTTFNSFIILRYFICGITSATFNIVSLYVFTDITHIWYLYSSIMAFLISLIISFTLQKFVVFRDMKTSKIHHQFSKFFVAIALGVITNTTIIFICVDIFGIWYIFSQVIAGFFVMIQNFIFYKFLIFNK